MKKIIFSLLALSMTFATVNAQKLFTRAGNISFYSDAPLEKIEAHNNTATCVLDTESGRMQFAVLIKAFQFEKALMQEHFNENYMESGEFPKSTFKGQIQNLEEVDFANDGEYKVAISGELTIHGVTQEVEVDGLITVKEGAVSATTNFTVLVADYGIKIPNLVKDNIAKEVRVDVDVALEELKR